MNGDRRRSVAGTRSSRCRERHRRAGTPATGRATWWGWNYTTWVTNELDPSTPSVTALMLAVMLGCLVLAVAIPDAFGEHGLLFAGAYASIQIGRHLFLTFVAAVADTVERARARQILIWFCVSVVFWIAGGVAHGGLRETLWLIALAIDYTAPLHVFWVPGRRRVSLSDWQVATSHFAERFSAFIIIALGECVVLIGASADKAGISLVRFLTLCLAFASSACLFLLYFHRATELAQRRVSSVERQTEAARDAYTYLHVVLVAGITLAAVGDEFVIVQPTATLTTAQAVVTAAGPAIYLVGLSIFRHRMAGTLSPTRTAGAVGCVLAGAVGLVAPAFVLDLLLLGVLVTVLVTESAARRGSTIMV